MPSSRSKAVLVVEDESIVAHDIQQTLVGLGYDAFAVASSAEEAWARAAERRPDVALVDVRIKGRTDGIKTAQHLQERFDVPIVFLTAHADHADDGTVGRGKQTRPSAYLLRPVKSAELRSAIEIALFNQDAERASPETRTPPRGVRALGPPARAGRAPGVRAVRRQLEQILS